MDKLSYLQFEDAMRGSQEIICGRLQVYLPLIAPLKEVSHNHPRALDLGSGRGEWLGILQEAGWDALGVDNNESMASYCQDRGYKVEQTDILDYLGQSEAESFDLVSAFHLAEHLVYSDLIHLLENCIRVLKPGGVLLMETPNPQNLLVGCSEFYVDPTHQRPIPPRLLEYSTINAGFNFTRIIYLNTLDDIPKEMPQLREVILGTGYDYAVFGQKPGGIVSTKAFSAVAENEVLWNDDLSLAKKLENFDSKLQEMYILSKEIEKLKNNIVVKMCRSVMQYIKSIRLLKK